MGTAFLGPGAWQRSARSWTDGAMQRLTGISLHLCASFLRQPRAQVVPCWPSYVIHSMSRQGSKVRPPPPDLMLLPQG
ncbi:hypothetical protein CgunFtcFv8_017878 [Champsocephalus gunnari]|uniref:Uncharacterized protein n=1 Tax=Champsocephalus gunnari TaxID=52237 RepID=A0AAN8DLB6_CHAGU|nr:hypothetical protein CgunFtcFv8_017878 [Champsocephalus gunnari]